MAHHEYDCHKFFKHMVTIVIVMVVVIASDHVYDAVIMAQPL